MKQEIAEVVPRVVKFIERKSRMVITRAWGRGSEVLVLNEFGKMKKFWRWMVVMVTQHCESTSYHRIIHLKMVKMVHFYVMYILPHFSK